MARKSTRTTSRRSRGKSEITRLRTILAASNEGKFGPNPKGVAGSKFVNGEERGQNPKEWPVSQSDGEEMVVEFGEEVVEKMEFG